MVRRVELNNASFERAGITKDCKEAICEYIWNGFEAHATRVSVSLIGSSMQEAMSIQVTDNGDGIKYNELNRTFGAFLSSTKNASSIRIKSQTNKGKGRFSYQCFSHSAQWTTIFDDEGTLKKYKISMSSADQSNFTTSELIEIGSSECPGTAVVFPIAEPDVYGQLSYPSMKQKLLQEFSWFLYLNKARNFTLEYMGIPLDYSEYINTGLSRDEAITIEKQVFSIDTVVWKKNIDNMSKIYFLSENGEVQAAINTSFNKNTVGFYHGVFVISSFIDSQNTAFLQRDNSEQLTVELQGGEEKGSSRKIFEQLRQRISELISEVLKNFLSQKADEEIAGMGERGSWPKFSSDDYGQLRKKDFMRVAKELYCTAPRIFYQLNDEQEKSLLGFLNLLLSSDERENVLSIVEHVAVNLTAEQRKKFADVLRRTKLEYIIEAISIIDRRLAIITDLKKIVYAMAKFANERDHIQKIVEQHFWLFGEQYHLLTADRTLATSLKEFEKITEVVVADSDMGMSNGEAAQRADIFLYSKQVQEDNTTEMVIVELKAPCVKLSLDVYNQVVRYVNTIRKDRRFNSGNRIWRFYAVCATVDDDVKVKYANFKQHGRRGLVDIIAGNFEIYALSWDDVFQAFEARHSFLLSKLKIDLTQAAEALDIDQSNIPSRQKVDELSRKVISLQAG